MSAEQNKSFIKQWISQNLLENYEPWTFIYCETIKNDQFLDLVLSFFPEQFDLSKHPDCLHNICQLIKHYFQHQKLKEKFSKSSTSDKYKTLKQLMDNHHLLSQEIAIRRINAATFYESFWHKISDSHLFLLKLIKFFPADVSLNQLLINDIFNSLEEAYDNYGFDEFFSLDKFLSSINSKLNEIYNENVVRYQTHYARSQLISCLLENRNSPEKINLVKLPELAKEMWGKQIIIRNSFDLKSLIKNSILDRFKVLAELADLIARELTGTEQSEKLDTLNKELSSIIAQKQAYMIDCVDSAANNDNKLFYDDSLDRAAFKRLLKRHFAQIAGQVIDKIAHCTGHTYRETKAAFSHLEPYAIWGFNRNPVATIHGKNIQIDIPFKMQLTEEQIKEFKAVLTGKPPKWFSTLSAEEKHWVINNCQLIISGQKICPPAIIRKLPGITNCSLQINVTLNDRNEIMTWEESSLRRHNLTLDIKDTFENARITLQNAKQLFNIAQPERKFKQFWHNTFDLLPFKNRPKPFIVDVGALSPLMTFPYALYDIIFQYGDNNTDMREGQHHAIKSIARSQKSFDVVSINLPVNSEREESNGFTDILNLDENHSLINNISAIFLALKNHLVIDQLGLKPLLSDIARYIKKDPINIEGLKDALSKLKTKTNNTADIVKEIDDLKNNLSITSFIKQRKQIREEMMTKHAQLEMLNKLKKISFGLEALINYLALFAEPERPDHNNKGLFAAAYLITAVNSFGGTVTGGCKSAKDRWGLVSVLVTAMSKFADGNLPVLDAQGNISPPAFIDCFADTYLAGHQQFIASTNNPGNEGLQEGCGILSKINDYFPMLPHCVKEKIEEKSRNYVFVNQVLSTQKHFVPKFPGSWFDSVIDYVKTKWHGFCRFFKFTKTKPVSIDVNLASQVEVPIGGSVGQVINYIGVGTAAKNTNSAAIVSHEQQSSIATVTSQISSTSLSSDHHREEERENSMSLSLSS